MSKSRKWMLIIPIVYFFQGCIPYLYHVGKEQIRIVFKKEKIQKAIPKIQDSTIREKLQFVEEVRRFAIHNLFLNPEGGFVYYVGLDREEIGWNVSASYPLKFESYEWWFPIVGNVPYKGFFELEKAKKEENDLIGKGLDTRIRSIGGYSTLGWFSDPIFSSQLKMDDLNIAGLVFHEMAHSTLYFNGDGVFNESYASFIEEEGLKEFCKTHKMFEQIQKREKKKSENQFITDFIRKTASQLKELYEKKIPDSEKLEAKELIIDKFKESILQRVKFSSEERKKFIDKKMNNEDFIGYLRYNSGGNFFGEAFEKTGRNFQKFHAEMEKLGNLSKEERGRLIGK